MSILGRVMVIAAATAAVTVVGSAVASAEPGPDGKYYGAIAMREQPGQDAWGAAWNHPTQASADRAALNECGNCSTILVQWSDGCASVAENTRTTLHTAGVGATRAEAERNALDELRRINQLPTTGSFENANDPGHILLTYCNG
ncbi:DUF4189 domain-containing protein [Nocardia otitidiscaviarum]|uniref:DUF4189 domain-containing protein n=1 Tax=Nocardia otitidiscaviarum TaxID=1823 RepID=UPI001892D5BC|nr:DUF4189 domain-containing protein [Nocardia otitidiscaviarum]MBF6237752.1 DUF4189 domain-containing protein [Nocardia otitidiscaviarum]